jgi:hypothetical protein
MTTERSFRRTITIRGGAKAKEQGKRMKPEQDGMEREDIGLKEGRE